MKFTCKKTYHGSRTQGKNNNMIVVLLAKPRSSYMSPTSTTSKLITFVPIAFHYDNDSFNHRC
jgi:hypothetical protein